MSACTPETGLTGGQNPSHTTLTLGCPSASGAMASPPPQKQACCTPFGPHKAPEWGSIRARARPIRPPSTMLNGRGRAHIEHFWASVRPPENPSPGTLVGRVSNPLYRPPEWPIFCNFHRVAIWGSRTRPSGCTFDRLRHYLALLGPPKTWNRMQLQIKHKHM